MYKLFFFHTFKGVYGHCIGAIWLLKQAISESPTRYVRTRLFFSCVARYWMTIKLIKTHCMKHTNTQCYTSPLPFIGSYFVGSKVNANPHMPVPLAVNTIAPARDNSNVPEKTKAWFKLRGMARDLTTKRTELLTDTRAKTGRSNKTTDSPPKPSPLSCPLKNTRVKGMTSTTALVSTN